MPTEVKLPFQALADDGLQAEERLTLCVLYAYANEDGIIMKTPPEISIARDLHPNSTRRHLRKLEALKYVKIIYRQTRLERDPVRKEAEGFALMMRPDGSRWPTAPKRGRIGSPKWDSKKRWGN